MAAYFRIESRSSSCGMVCICPHATSYLSTSRAHIEAMWANRSENAPFTRQSMRPAGAQRIADSIIPVADDELMYTGRSVMNSGRSPR